MTGNAHNIVCNRLRSLRAGGMSYRQIATHHGGISPAMVWRMVNRDYEPKRFDIRRKLGYPIICPNCGHEFEESE